MSNLYDDASLIMFPSGYKAGKAYSLKPTDGSGDLTFTRASSATRVNSDGLIENAFVLGSELVTNGDFPSGTTAWSFGGGWSLGVGVAEANGSTSTSNLLTQNLGLVSAKTYTISFSSNRVGGTLFVKNGTLYSSGTIYTLNTGTGLEVQTFTVTSPSSSAIGFYAYNYEGTIDNVSVKEVITNNVPRIDYTGGGCGKLLLEPQRTNSLTYSEQFDNAAWVKVTNPTITANATTSPDGTTNADKLIPSTSVGRQAVSQNNSSTGAVSMSVYAKKGEYDIVQLTDSRNPTAFANFDLTNGVLGSVSDFTATIASVGSGWYRCSISYNYTLSLSAFRISVQQLATSVRLPEWAGNGTDGIYIWGAQLEAGSYPTSYIPTTTTAVTRVKDSASKDSLSVFGTNVGSLFVDAEGPYYDGDAGYLFDLSDNVNSSINRFGVYSANSTNLTLFTNASLNFAASVTARKKIAVIWNGTNTKLYLNGVKVLDFTYANANPTSINLNSRYNESQYGNSKFNQVLAFPTALSDTDAITLTTL
jgi:uncharacterized protein with GYD domain